jgi:hypothetical protein
MKEISGRTVMRNRVIGSIILLTIALTYGAIAQVDLSGAKAEAVLNEVNTPGLTINTSANVAIGGSENVRLLLH